MRKIFAIFLLFLAGCSFLRAGDWIIDYNVGTVSANDTVLVGTIDISGGGKLIKYFDICLTGSASADLPLSILLRRYEPDWKALEGTDDSTLVYDEMRLTIDSGTFYLSNNLFSVNPGKFRLYLWNESGSASLSNVKVRVKGW